jgi:hypothetical protein
MPTPHANVLVVPPLAVAVHLGPASPSVGFVELEQPQRRRPSSAADELGNLFMRTSHGR